MDPMHAWTLVAFVTLMSVALMLLEFGMRRARSAQARRSPSDPPLRRARDSR